MEKECPVAGDGWFVTLTGMRVLLENIEEDLKNNQTDDALCRVKRFKEIIENSLSIVLKPYDSLAMQNMSVKDCIRLQEQNINMSMRDKEKEFLESLQANRAINFHNAK